MTCTLAITTDYLLLFLYIVYFFWSVWDMVHQQQLGYGDTIERYTITEIVPYVQQIKRSSWAAQSGLWCFKGNRIWCLNSTRRKNPVSGIVPNNCTDYLEPLDLSVKNHLSTNIWYPKSIRAVKRRRNWYAAIHPEGKWIASAIDHVDSALSMDSTLQVLSKSQPELTHCRWYWKYRGWHLLSP